MTYTRIVCLAGVFAAAGVLAPSALAQVTPPLLTPVKERASAIEGACVPKAVVQVVVKTGKGSVRLEDAACGEDGRFRTGTEAVPLVASYEIVATQTAGGVTSAQMIVGVQKADAVFADQREDMESTAYVGLAIDTFGAQELNRYLNPEANGDIRERSIFGIDFAYRLVGGPSTRRQVWIYGETLHGVRSEDIDCEKTPALPSCQQELAGLATDLAKTPFFLLRNASSLEAYLGVRVELRQVQLPGRHPAALYVNFQPGFLEVSGSDGDAKAAHHVGIGARVIGGRMAGSYLELGFGKTDLFILNRNRRFKFDGMLQRELPGGLSLFAQLFADVDMRDGSDSIQSYFGLNFDVAKLFNPAPAGNSR
jgi:hypothetical protein